LFRCVRRDRPPSLGEPTSPSDEITLGEIEGGE
jgi:hypothetical protein